jgi:hypothetical protein
MAMSEAKNAQREMRRGDQRQYKIGLRDVCCKIPYVHIMSSTVTTVAS